MIMTAAMMPPISHQLNGRTGGTTGAGAGAGGVGAGAGAGGGGVGAGAVGAGGVVKMAGVGAGAVGAGGVVKMAGAGAGAVGAGAGGAAKMAKGVKWLISAVIVLVTGSTVETRSTHTPAFLSHQAITKSSSLIPSGISAGS